MTPLQKEFCLLFPDKSPIIRTISKIGEYQEGDKHIRSNAPTPRKANAKLKPRSFWYVVHYHIWPRLFGKDAEKQAVALDYLQRQKKHYQNRDRIYPPRPIFINS